MGMGIELCKMGGGKWKTMNVYKVGVVDRSGLRVKVKLDFGIKVEANLKDKIKVRSKGTM